MPTLQILTIPKSFPRPGDAAGALYLTEVDLTADPPDSVEQNDIPLLFVFDADITGLDLTRIVLSAEDENGNDISNEVSFIGELMGKGCSYSTVVRFPHSGGAGKVTVTVPSDSVSEGNPETSVTVAYSDDFPQADWASLFNATGYDQIVSVDAEHVYLRDGAEIHGYDHNGNRVEALDATVATGTITALRLDADTFLSTAGQKLARYRNQTRLWESADVLVESATNALTLTEDGRLLFFQTTTDGLQELPMEAVHAAIIENTDLEGTMPEDVSLDNGDFDDLRDDAIWYLACDRNTLYIEERTTGDHWIYCYDAEYHLLPSRRIPIPNEFVQYAPLSLFYWGGLLFRLDTKGGLHFLDVSVWDVPRPLGAIYPMEVAQGDRLDLFKFIHGATNVVFDVGFEKPDWVSLEDNRYLVVADDAPVNAPAYIRLRGINAVGGSEQHACGFYVSVTGVQTPVWRNIAELSMRTDQKINLFEYVSGADTIEYAPNSKEPSFLRLTGGVLHIIGEGTTATLHLRAGTRAGFFADTQLRVNIHTEPEIVSILDVADYQVLIENIDVTSYLIGEHLPSVSNSLDYVQLNQFTRGRCEVVLRSNSENGGYFNATNPNSFWKENQLNENGFLNTIVVLVNLQKAGGTVQKVEVFKGIIFENDDSLDNGMVTLRCYDSSYALKEKQIAETVSGISKVLELEPSQTEDTPVSQGIYRVESTFGAMLPKDSQVYSESQPLVLKETSNALEGVVENNTAFATAAEIQTQGGYLYDDIPVPLLAKTETPYRYLPLKSAVEKLIKIEPIALTTYIQENEGTGDAHIRSNGNLAFPTERGRLLKYPADWIVDSQNRKLYYLLTNPVNTISDELVCYDLNTDTHQVLYQFAPEIAVLKVASSDFDTFAVLLADAIDFDRSVETIPKTPRAVAESQDASLNATTQIVTYQQSEHLYRTLIGKDTDFRPQVALHYWTGVSGQDYAWQGITPGDRGPFIYDGTVLYRYANGTEFGVAARAVDGTLTALFTQDKDPYYNHLNFAFDVDSEGDTYFASVTGTENDCTLRIEKRSGNTTETIFQRTQFLFDFTEFDTEAGAWLGVQELLVDGDNFYMIVPVSRNGRDISTGAGVILYRFSRVTLQLTALAKYNFVQYGPCMLTKYDGDVYFVESPAASYDFDVRNRAVTFDNSEAKGFLKRIKVAENGKIETIGNVYFDDGNAYRGHLPMKALVFDDDLHFIMGYGQPAVIGRHESDASRPENWQWISFGKKYRYKVPVLPRDGTVSTALGSLAKTTGTTVSIDRNIVSLQNRQAKGAVTADSVTQSDTQIAYAFATAELPTQGYLLIGSELVRYTGKTDTHFTGVSRGKLSTEIAAHDEGSLITFIHRTIEEKTTIGGSEPYIQVTVSLDVNHLYNTVQEGNPPRLVLSDLKSQKQFGNQNLLLDTGTTEHELPFSEFISRQYLDRFKDLSYLINVRVRAFYALNLGEFVCFKYLTNTPGIDGFLLAMQVMSVQTTGAMTRIRGRQVTPIVTPVVPPTTHPVHVTDGAGDHAFFADGAGTVVGWYGNPRYFDTTPAFEVNSLTALRLTQYAQMEPVVFPEAVSPVGHSFDYRLAALSADGDVIPLPKGVLFDARTRTLRGVPNAVQVATDYMYTATDSEGQIVSLIQSIEVNAGAQMPRHTTDGADNTFFVDGVGNAVRWYGH